MGHSIAAHHDRPRAAVVDEHEVRAAAGLTMVIGAVAFAYAYFAKQYVPLQVSRQPVLRRVPDPGHGRPALQPHRRARSRDDARPRARARRSAWTLGLLMALAMTVITNSGIRGPLPRSMCDRR